MRVRIQGFVDPYQTGIYLLQYEAEDDSGNSSGILVRTVVVNDEQPPTVTLIGDPVVFVEAGSSFSDPGILALDDVDGLLQFQITGVVDTSKVGTYTLTYNAIDSSGNQSPTLTRNVIVVDTQAPGDPLRPKEVRLMQGNPFQDPWGFAVDAIDGSVSLQLEGEVDTTNPVPTPSIIRQEIFPEMFPLRWCAW